MKLDFFKRPAPEQAVFIRETAARRGLLAVMVEKDFWVSWTLANLASPGSWTPVSLSPVVLKGQNVITNSLSAAQQFYRLSQ